MTAKGLRVYSTARYRIRVQGVLDATWSDRLGGLAITRDREPEDEDTVTALQGSLLDQAALLGILNTLYELRLPLLSVECLVVA